ncbi:MAG TPA: HNH endonuclease [Thermoanaerobaculia bacterium]|nr:HNH endonuclease [Thermoanaerobaculia bacterium]
MSLTRGYAEAFASLMPLPRLQAETLDALLAAYPHGLTAQQLARLLGCSDFVVVNSALGRLGHRVHDALGGHPDGLAEGEFQWWHVLATGERSGDGFRWCLRDAVVSALTSIGFGTPTPAHAGEIETDEPLYEGAVRHVRVNAYERNPVARRRCLEAHGCACTVCGFDFGEVYGPHAAGYIHVHHLTPLSEIREEYEIDPVVDMVPLCPNCHAAIHLRTPPFSIEEMQVLGRRHAD